MFYPCVFFPIVFLAFDKCTMTASAGILAFFPVGRKNSSELQVQSRQISVILYFLERKSGEESGDK